MWAFFVRGRGPPTLRRPRVAGSCSKLAPATRDAVVALSPEQLDKSGTPGAYVCMIERTAPNLTTAKEPVVQRSGMASTFMEYLQQVLISPRVLIPIHWHTHMREKRLKLMRWSRVLQIVHFKCR